MTTMQEMVNRFLTWSLPDDVCADNCATKAGYPHRTGTVLLTAAQAEAMLRHVTAGMTLVDAVAWVEKRRDDFVEEHGRTDPDTGALEFGSGAHAEAKTEYLGELTETIEGLRSLGAAEQKAG